MADPLTTNRGFAIPTRGSDPGTWDVAVNGNATMLDTILGGVGSIAVNPGDNHALTAAEIVNGTISVTGALTSNAVITFPAGVMGWWTVENLCTGPGVLLAAIASGTEAIGLPPGEITDIQVHGTTVRYRNLGRVGSYLDIAAATVPSWITVSTIPPYLNCAGQAFSAATYPALAQFLGRTTVPNFIGTLPAILNQGSGIIATARGGVDGDTLFSRGGTDSVTLSAAQIPSITSNVQVTVSGTSTRSDIPAVQSATPAGTSGFVVPSFNTFAAVNFTGSGTGAAQSNNTGGAAHSNMPPTTMGGIRLIRAA